MCIYDFGRMLQIRVDRVPTINTSPRQGTKNSFYTTVQSLTSLPLDHFMVLPFKRDLLVDPLHSDVINTSLHFTNKGFS